MKYAPLEARTIPALERYLKREARRMADMILSVKTNKRAAASERAIVGILLGEKFAYLHLLGELRRAAKRKRK